VAAGELGRLWETRVVAKEYLAIVHGHVREDEGLIDAPLGKDESSPVAVKDCVRADGAAAQTRYATEERFERAEGRFSLLRLAPGTGRKHQLRIHLAHLGHPIVGDKLYGSDPDCYMALVEDRLTLEQWQRLILPHQALHARALRFEWRGKAVEFICSPEPWFSAFAEPVR
jgi:23S rRNA pseudouridine1911/1915/1917 synthase